MIKIKSSGMDGVLEGLDKLAEQIDAGPGVTKMEEIGRAAMEDIDARFDSGGYGTWQPLSPVTVARKGGRTEILIDTSNMRNSVGIGELGDTRVTVTVPHGGKDYDQSVPGRHQQGESARNLPQRKIVEVTERLKGRITPIVMEWWRGWRG